MVRVALLSLLESIPPHVWGDGSDGNVMATKDMRLLWKEFVNAATNPQALLQVSDHHTIALGPKLLASNQGSRRPPIFFFNGVLFVVWQACLVLEQCVPRPFLKPWWVREWSSPSTATRRPATCHAVAHRVYTLYRAINMESKADGKADAADDGRMQE